MPSCYTAANVVSVCLACGSTVVNLSHMWTCVSLSHLCTACHNMIIQQLESACKAEKAVHKHMLVSHHPPTTTNPATADTLAVPTVATH